MKRQCFFKNVTGTQVRVKITDIGARSITGNDPPPYVKLLQAGDADIVGFEPDAQALAALNQAKGPHEIYLPYAVADGQQHTLYTCVAPGMTSLLKPNPAVLNLFHSFPAWGSVLSTEEIDTVRLDDVDETVGTDMIKIDIQGGELMAFHHAQNRLKDVLIIHTEVEFLQMYIDQPLFSEVEIFLRSRGFVFHRFFPLISRTFVPVSKNGNIYEGISQLCWADAVFVRDMTCLNMINDEQLLKLAMILHECYESADLAHYYLLEFDRRNGTETAHRYLSSLG